MSEEKKNEGEKFAKKSLEIHQSEIERLQARLQKIFDMGQEINRKIIAHSETLGRATEEIRKKYGGWLENLKKYYGKEDRKMSEILGFEKDETGITALEADLLLVSDGFTDEKYSSKISKLREEMSKLTTNLEKQKELTQKEKDARKVFEEESETKIRDIGRRLGELQTSFDDVKERTDVLAEKAPIDSHVTEELKSYLNAIFDYGFCIHLLREISKFSIPGIDINWQDEGIDYILSKEFKEFTEKEGALKIIHAEKKNDAKKLKELFLCKEYEEYFAMFEKLSIYCRDPRHVGNLIRLKGDINKARQAINSRKSKDLVWCGDYSKSCYNFCPGFTSIEQYCKVAKSTPYEKGRLGLMSVLFGQAYISVNIAMGLERVWRENEKI